MPGSRPTILSKKLYKLAIGGGIAFWATSIATSLLPIAAKYRASFADKSWSTQAVWAGSLLGGMIIALCVSYALLLLFDKRPRRNPILESVMLSLVALVISTILIDVPKSLLGPSDALHYFPIGIMLNIPRFLFLGIGIGYLYKGLYASAPTSG